MHINYCKQYAGTARTSDCQEPHNCTELQTTLQMFGNEITICLQRTFSPCFADISECTIAWLSRTSFRQQRSPNCLYFLIITGWLETTVSLSLDACWWLPSDSCYVCDITGFLVTVNSCQVMTSLVA